MVENKLNLLKEENFIRCFIALEIPREVINQIKKIQEILRKRNLFLGKFTEPENLHLTLKFLGEIDEQKVKAVQKKLKRIVSESFESKFGEIGIFSKKSFKILWLKIEGRGVWSLQKKIDKLLEEEGFKPEQRFMSHITLARIKKVFNEKQFLDYVKNMKIKKINFKTSEFILKKSELKPDGPIYTNLEEYRLE